jgi:hypothetical protein
MISKNALKPSNMHFDMFRRRTQLSSDLGGRVQDLVPAEGGNSLPPTTNAICGVSTFRSQLPKFLGSPASDQACGVFCPIKRSLDRGGSAAEQIEPYWGGTEAAEQQRSAIPIVVLSSATPAYKIKKPAGVNQRAF